MVVDQKDNQNDIAVLVTGAAGFIGSHTVLELMEAGFKVIAIDNFSNSIADESGRAVSLQRVSEIVGKSIQFIKCDLLSVEQLDAIFINNKFSAVIHLASLKSVGESVAKPLEYYENNITGFLNLIKACKQHKVKEFIFSSSATVYGLPSELPIRETSRTGQGITNPYGQTKYMIEQILMDLQKAEKDLKISILRYFNPVGAHPSGLIGEDPRDIPNNLMPYIAQVSIGKLPVLHIYGNKYDTPDGTGVRDYIHIVDLAKAHVFALKRLQKETEGVEIFNVGTGQGYSVKEMVAAFEKACGHKLKVEISPPRPGDLPSLYCDPSLAFKVLGWKAQFGINEMCRDTCLWIQKNPNGYSK